MTKAGSTALQRALEARREVLLAHGVLFPSAGFERASDPHDPQRTSGHLPLLRQIARGEVTDLEAECRAVGPGAHTLLLSAENVMDLPRQLWLESVRAPFGDREVEIVGVLRSQEGWLASRYWESVTKGFRHETRSLDRFALDLLEEGTFHHAANLDDVAERFQARRVTALPYDDLARKDRLLAAFLEAVGLPAELSHGPAAGRVNASAVDLETLEAQRRLNTSVRSMPREDALRWSADMRARGAARDDRTTRAPLPSPAVRAQLAEALRAPNRALSERWFGGRPFGPPEDWPLRNAPQPREDAVLDLARFGFRRLIELRAARRGSERPGRRGALDLTPDAADALHDALRRARVALAYGSAHDALWLAGWPGRLVTTVVAQPARLDHLERNIALGLPATSIVYPLAEPEGEWDGPAMWSRIWSEPFFRHPDLVLVFGPDPSAILAATRPRLARAVTVLSLVEPDGGVPSCCDASGTPEIVGNLVRTRLAPVPDATPPHPGGRG